MKNQSKNNVTITSLLKNRIKIHKKKAKNEDNYKKKAKNEDNYKKKAKNEDNYKKKTKKSKPIIDKKDSLDMLSKNFKINYPFYIIALFCLYFLSLKTNHHYINTVLSFIFISGFGYFVHWCSHIIPWTELYSNQDNLFTQNKYTDQLIRSFLNFMEFHDITHHDSSINKQFNNIVLEAVNNSVTQGLLFVFIAIIIKQIDLWACVLWALLYATFHNINYLFIKPETHVNHHINPTINLGIDVWDIIFNTKQPNEEPEDYNHYAINLVLLTIIICYFMPSNSILH